MTGYEGPSKQLDGRAPRRACILGFHRIVGSRQVDHDVSWKSFRGLVEELGHSPTAVSIALDAEPVEPTVILTFDDATADHLKVARFLAQLRMPGIFFVPAGKLGRGGYLSRGDLKELVAMGHVVGSHAFSHVPLDSVEPKQLPRELLGSKEALEDIVDAPVRWFAPPGGVTPRGLPTELEKAGYRLSRSMIWGIRGPDADRWRLPCVPVTDFTLRAGWVKHALRSFELPVAMKLAWRVKELLPTPIALRARKLMHRRGS
jgi:peptidoglycan/xylan/chitin deacetylase (PgdA/CDA1 family)